MMQSDRDELARQMYIGDNWGVAEPERRWDELLAHPVEFERYRARADVLWAAGWRKKPTIVQIADQVMLNAIYHGREGSVMDEASRDDFEYDYALQTAHAILALMDGLSDE